MKKKFFLKRMLKNKYAYIIVALFLAVIAFYFLADNSSTPTGNAAFEVTFNNLRAGEKLEGSINFNMREGELVPKDSQVVISYAGKTETLYLSELSTENSIFGNFFAENSQLSGSGEGYGVAGSRVIIPVIDFDMRVFYPTEKDSSAETTSSEGNSFSENETGSSQEEESQEEISTDENESEIPSESSFSESSSLNTESSAESSSTESDSSSSESISGESSSITGNVIGEDSYITSGKVSLNEEFTYNVESGQRAEIVLGSVRVGDEVLSENVISLRQSGNRVLVSTNYFLNQQGFGEDFLGEYVLTIYIDMADLNLIAQDGVLEIKLIHNGVEISSNKRTIRVSPERPDLLISDEPSEIFEEIPSTEENLIILKEIPTIRISPGSSAELNLEEFFDGAESYSLNIENIDVRVVDGSLSLIPEEGFVGARKAKIRALAGSNILESNEFLILVSSGAVRVETTRNNKIRLNEPVKWETKVVLQDDERVIVEIPEKSENIKVIKLEEEISGSLISGNVITEIKITNERKSWFRRNVIEPTKTALTRISGSFTGRAISEIEESQKQDILLEKEGAEIAEFIIEYETPGPISFEREIEKGKEIIISDPNKIGYEEIIAFTEFETNVPIENSEKVKVYWIIPKSRTNSLDIEKAISLVPSEIEEIAVVESTDYFEMREKSAQPSLKMTETENEIRQEIFADKYDLSGDGKIDYFEWVVPHLSNQTYQIIIEITNAEHLDEEREFISDIFNEVKERDGIWSEQIPENHFVRVKFETSLNSNRDITIYPRTTSGSPRIEIYEINGDEIIASFDSIIDNEYNKVYLTNLVGEQDTFDLKILDGGVEFDHIIDPTGTISITLDSPAHDATNISKNPNLRVSPIGENDYFNVTFQNRGRYISAGVFASCGILKDGIAYCWGSGTNGRLGYGGIDDQFNPILLNNTNDFIKIAEAYEGGCGIASNGTAYCWGVGTQGQLGTGGTSSTNNTVAVNSPNKFVDITAARLHTCGIIENGTAYCWGSGGNGRLGDGGTTQRNSPVPINSTETFTMITVPKGGTTAAHTCAISTGGTAYCWGLANEGQLGYGGVSQQNNPVAVNSTEKFIYITNGNGHTCGIIENGTAYCWGRATEGQLGYGGTTQQDNPSAVNLSAKFIRIDAGASHTCGIIENGTAYCWGFGSNGRLGDGGTTQRNSPVAVNSSLTFVDISGGNAHTCAIASNGTAYCWGSGTNGRLGYGSNAQQVNPIAVNSTIEFPDESFIIGTSLNVANATQTSASWTGLEANSTYIWSTSASDGTDFSFSNIWKFTTGESESDEESDTTPPTISFGAETPADEAEIEEDYFFVNLETSDESPHYAFLDFNNDLLLWITMDNINGTGDPTDASQYSNNGTAINGATQSEEGKFGKAFSFDGDNDFISIPSNVHTNILSGKTLSFWLKSLSTPDEFDGILGKATDTNWNDGYGMWFEDSSTICFYAGAWTGGAGDACATSLTTSNWMHVVVVINSTGSSIYIDTVLKDTGSGVGTSTSAPLRLGSIDGNYFSNVLIDELIIFNRTLTSAEINSLYGAESEQYSNNFTELNDGIYTFTGHAVDAFGNRNSTTRSVTIQGLDETPPAVTIVYPENTTYNSAISTLNYTATDDYLDSCWYSLNGGASNTSITCGQNVTGLSASQGSNTWTVYANDTSGNVGFYSVTFFVDSVSPLIGFISPTPPTSTNSQSALTINVSATDTNFQNITVRLYNSAHTLLQTNTSTSPTFSITYNVADGVYHYNATAYDIAGNSNSTETRNYIRDRVAPIFSDRNESPLSPATYSPSQSYLFRSTVSDSYLENVWLIFNGETYPASVIPGEELSTYTHRLNITGISAGSHTFRWVANDTAGNEGHLPNIFDIGTDDWDTYGYTINKASSEVNLTFNGTEGNTSIELGSSLLLNGTRITGDSSGTLRLYLNGELINEGTGTISNTTTFSEVGLFNVTITYVESQNYSSSSETYFVSVADSVAPLISYGSGVLPDDVYIKTNNLFVNVSASDLDLSNITINLYDEGGLLYSNVSSSNQYSINYTNLEDGVYYYNATALDSSGNSNSTETLSLIIDTIPPEIQFGNGVSPNGTIQNSEEIFVNITTSDEHDHYKFIDFDQSNILWLRFDDVPSNGFYTDLSSHNNLIQENAPAQFRIPNGKYGYARSSNFEDPVFAYSAEALNFNASGNYTWSFWVNWRGGNSGILHKGDEYGTSGYLIEIDSDGKIGYLDATGGYLKTVENIPQNSWTHITVTYSNADIEIYIFDEKFGDGTVGNPLASDTENNLYIGSTNPTYANWNYFNGSIDDVLIFNRTLSYSEILVLSNPYPILTNTFNVDEGIHTFIGYGVDIAGNLNSTETRSITINSSLISSCGELTTGDYFLLNNVSTEGTCFTINEPSVTLDAQGFSIIGDNDGIDYGFNIADGVIGFVLRNASINGFHNGINLLGDDSEIIGSTIESTSNAGIYLEDNSNNLIRNVTITSSEKYGVLMNGSIAQNFTDLTIDSSGADAIYITNSNSSLNSFTNIQIANTNSSHYDLFFATESINETTFINSFDIGSYSFTGTGGKISVIDEEFGEIIFLESVSGSGTDFGEDIHLEDNLASISESQSGLNKSANITLYGIGERGFTNPQILRNGFLCLECTALTELDGENVSFNITQSGNYSIGEVAYAIDLSSTLQQGISVALTSLPSVDVPASGNNETGFTEYYVNLSTEGTLVDVYIKASGDLLNEGNDVLGLGNETYAFSLNNANVSSEIKSSLTTDYLGGQIGSGLADGDVVYLRFYFSAPAGQPSGVYNNSVSFTLTPHGISP